MSKPVITFVFKVLRNRLLRYILYIHVQTCDNVRVQSATQSTASVHTLHFVQTCDNVRVQSATQSTASVHTLHMSKPVITFVFKVLRNRLLRYILYIHVQTCDNVRVQSATQSTASVHTLHFVQTCDNVRVQSATQWTASVHTLHMSKPVITFVFKVLRNRLLRYILCPNL